MRMLRMVLAEAVPTQKGTSVQMGAASWGWVSWQSSHARSSAFAASSIDGGSISLTA
jgi:hypothetical protein